MTLQEKINRFIGKAQFRISELALLVAGNYREAYTSIEDIKLATELINIVGSLQDPLNDWTDFKKEKVVDYYNYKASLTDNAVEIRRETVILAGNSNSDWVPSYNALSATVTANEAYFRGEIQRVDSRIDNLDFSNLVPQETQ